MNSADILFVIFGALAAIAALGMVFTKNVFRAAFLLLICLVAIAGLYVILTATFLAIVQLLVYAGGVVVLLAFGVMITSRSKSRLLESKHHLLLPGLIAFVGTASMLISVFAGIGPRGPARTVEEKVDFIGQSFMTEYILAFEIIAFMLLLVLVGSAFYAKSSSNS